MRMIAAFVVFAMTGLFVAGADPGQRPENVSPGGSAQPGHAGNQPGDMPKDMRAMNEMMGKHLATKDAEFDRRFIDLMIPHHEGAIIASRQALKNASRPELKEMAEKSLKEQEKELEQLKKWRQQWYGQK